MDVIQMADWIIEQLRADRTKSKKVPMIHIKRTWLKQNGLIFLTCFNGKKAMLRLI
jgi:hypothetical protein